MEKRSAYKGMKLVVPCLNEELYEVQMVQMAEMVEPYLAEILHFIKIRRNDRKATNWKIRQGGGLNKESIMC